MKKQSFDFLNSYIKITESTYEVLKNISELKKVKAGTQLVKLGEIPTKAYMLMSGAVRCYITTESGKEYNKNFYLSGSIFASFTDLMKKKSSLLVFEALTDCTVYEINYYKLMQLCDKNLTINKLYTKVLEVTYSKYETRLIELITLDATARYLELRKHIPDLDALIPQYHIASYLGITPVQLSRIRKQTDTI